MVASQSNNNCTGLHCRSSTAKRSNGRWELTPASTAMRDGLPTGCAHTCPADTMCRPALQVTDYLERQSDERNQAKVALRRVEHFYYKTDVVSVAKARLHCG